MPPLIILKIGGSVATYKNRPGLAIRTAHLKRVALAIRDARATRHFRLILIHGSGSAGHQIAHDFDLKNGTGSNPKKIDAAIRSQRANQELDAALASIFVQAGVPVIPIHTASVILQRKNIISHFDTKTVEMTLRQGNIPMLYGEMVSDTTLGFSVCSGDAIATLLAEKFSAQKIYFASDIDGVFTRDPHRFPDASLIEQSSLDDLALRSKISGSHNVDVTGGLGGKIRRLLPLRHSSVRQIEIFNGLRASHYTDILTDIYFPHTLISLNKKKGD